MNNRSNDLRQDIFPAAPFLLIGQRMLQIAHPIHGFVPRDMAVPKDMYLRPEFGEQFSLSPAKKYPVRPWLEASGKNDNRPKLSSWRRRLGHRCKSERSTRKMAVRSTIRQKGACGYGHPFLGTEQ